jgi:hypothetical protein
MCLLQQHKGPNMQTQHLLNKVCSTVQQLHKDAIAALQLATTAQTQYNNSGIPDMMTQHNMQVLIDMLQDAFKHIDDAACTASDLYAD